MNKSILLIIFLLIAYLGCKDSDVPCPPCETLAFKITMYDTLTNNKINGFTITATDENNNTITTNDTLFHPWVIDSSYEIPSQGGIYTLVITHPNYLTITLNNMVVEQGKCSPNTRILKLYPKQIQNIIKDSTAKGCGNP